MIEKKLKNISKIVFKIIKIFCTLMGLMVFLTIILYGIMRMTAMEEKVLNQIPSPDGKWIAITQDEEYASMFSTPLYAVVLQPQTGWFRRLREKKVFEISQESATVPPTAKWDDSTHLVIEGYGLKRDITLQIPEYEPIRLTYKIE